MRYLLSTRSREALRQFAGPDTLLAFDFDGVLAPIVAEPERARMLPSTRALLRRLAECRTCLVLSGRARNDLRKKMEGTGIRRLIGNHGAEPWDGAHGLRNQVTRWEDMIAPELASLPGVWIENKALSLTVHFRRCRRKTEARCRIAAAAGLLADVRLIEGNQCISIVSPTAPHKGDALRAEAERLRFGQALFVGDDETDEDVFALAGRAPRLFTVRVGRRNRSQAGYYLRSQAEVDELLRELLRRASAHGRLESAPQLRRARPAARKPNHLPEKFDS